jgi:hypothetical protein
LFKIESTSSFNTDRLVDGDDFDYVTRTSINQGVLQTTGFINEENINNSGSWSLGLLQMDFFYRKKPWYAGQFVRKVSAKDIIKDKAVPFFTTVLNKLSPILSNVLVRNVNKTFNELKVKLPVKNGEMDFDFMEDFIAELEAERIAELEAYLLATGLNDYTLTDEEQEVLQEFDKINFQEFDVIELFTVKNSGNILSRDIVENSGDTPYLCASSENNAVSSHVSYDEKFIDKGNCIFIGGKTFVVTYQEKDFYSNDSHNLILYLKNEEEKSKFNQLFMATCINKSLGHKYSWGDSISNKKIQTDKVSLPTKSKQPNYGMMETFITAIQKLVIKDVVLYANRKNDATKSIVNKEE